MTRAGPSATVGVPRVPRASPLGAMPVARSPMIDIAPGRSRATGAAPRASPKTAKPVARGPCPHGWSARATRRASALLAGVLAAGARAQTYPPETMDFILTLRDSGNANGVVEPGEVVEMSVGARFTPGVGQPTVWNNYPGSTGVSATVVAFAGSRIDVIGIQGSSSGSLTWLIPPLVNVGLPGTLEPLTNSVLDSWAAQLLDPPSPLWQMNPMEIWRGVWTPASFEPRMLAYRVHPLEGFIFVWAGYPLPVAENTINTGSQASIQIVPEPGVAIVLAIAAGAVARVRRRT